MKKKLLIFLVLALLAILPSTAAAESTVLTLEVPQPSYQLNIPTGAGLAYGQQSYTLAVPTVGTASDFKEGMTLQVTISYSGSFTGDGGSIPYSLALTDDETETDLNSGDCLFFDTTEGGGLYTNGHTADGTVPTGMVLHIAPAAWEAAFPGSYTAAITYSAVVSH